MFRTFGIIASLVLFTGCSRPASPTTVLTVQQFNAVAVMRGSSADFIRQFDDPTSVAAVAAFIASQSQGWVSSKCDRELPDALDVSAILFIGPAVKGNYFGTPDRGTLAVGASDFVWYGKSGVMYKRCSKPDRDAFLVALGLDRAKF